MSMKNSMTQFGIEPATFLFVATAVPSELLKCGDFSSCLDLVSIRRRSEQSKVILNGSKDLKNEQTEKKETRGKEVEETRETRERLKDKHKAKKNKDKGKTKKSK
jgi:hypothetical protein